MANANETPRKRSIMEISRNSPADAQKELKAIKSERASALGCLAAARRELVKVVALCQEKLDKLDTFKSELQTLSQQRANQVANVEACIRTKEEVDARYKAKYEAMEKDIEARINAGPPGHPGPPGPPALMS